MKFTIAFSTAFSFLLFGCMEGPAGPSGNNGVAGRDGVGGFIKDSIVIDIMAGFIFLNNNRSQISPSTVELSNRGTTMFPNLDTSMLVFDSVVYRNGSKNYIMLSNPTYIPFGFEAYLEISQNASLVNDTDYSDSTNWVFRTPIDSTTFYYSEFVNPMDKIITSTNLEYYPGKGFSLGNLITSPAIGKAKIYYWK